jgi:hypothetical protein
MTLSLGKFHSLEATDVLCTPHRFRENLLGHDALSWSSLATKKAPCAPNTRPTSAGRRRSEQNCSIVRYRLLLYTSGMTRKISVLLADDDYARFDQYCRDRGHKKSTLASKLIHDLMERECVASQRALFQNKGEPAPSKGWSRNG